MRRRNCRGWGFTFAAFGAGLLVASICPPKLMLIIIAAVLVCLGCSRVMN